MLFRNRPPLNHPVNSGDHRVVRTSYAVNNRRHRAIVLCILASCGGDTSTSTSPSGGNPSPPNVSPRLALSLSGPRTDTILFSTPLVITVTSADSRPATAASVSFDVTKPGPTSLQPILYFEGGVAAVQHVDATTDAAGQARVTVRSYGPLGTCGIRVTVPTYGLSDSLIVTVMPGSAYRLKVGPSDTTLYASRTYQLAANPIDQAGNALPNKTAWVSRRPDVASVDGTTGKVTTVNFGRVWFVGTQDRAVDSVALSVVPQGQVAAYTLNLSTGDHPAIFASSLDGTNYVKLASPINDVTALRWAPSGDRLVYEDFTYINGNSTIRLFTADMFGHTALLNNQAVQPANDVDAWPSPDGQWVYFVLRSATRFEIWRERWDGSGMSRVSPISPDQEFFTQPSPSPDGARLVYLWVNGVTGASVFRTMSTSGANIADVGGMRGLRPVWSPDSRRIAFYSNDAGIVVTTPDGSTSQTFGTSTHWDNLNAQLDWSPDGKWLIGCAFGSASSSRELILISVSTGELIELPFSRRDRLCEVSWRPAS